VCHENNSHNCGVDIFNECFRAGISSEGREQVACAGEAKSPSWVQTSRNSQRHKIVGWELCSKRIAEFTRATRFYTSSRREVEKKTPAFCELASRGAHFLKIFSQLLVTRYSLFFCYADSPTKFTRQYAHHRAPKDELSSKISGN
jgi:hypothetical protein